ncbi:molybdenum cofactor guanylyltransferase [Bacillus songklensis]|uniref:Molybdenum cofactor guanylyltransferase n=1 Tax=Bacillus songklensis TaxID=1069116 RepID=A0ABV8AYS8_9BACI
MLTGVILAGGKNDVLNDTLKSFLNISERYTIDYQLHEMRKICQEILIVTNTPQAFLRYVPRDIRIITDYFKNCGALGGMHSALSLSQSPFVWVTACGMPFISSQAADYMSKLCQERKADAVLPILHTKAYPFHGIYHKRILPAVKAQIRFKNGSLENLVNTLNWIGVSEKDLYSMNIPESMVFTIKNNKDYETAQNLAGQISLC